MLQKTNVKRMMGMTGCAEYRAEIRRRLWPMIKSIQKVSHADFFKHQ
jgi:hypothetical protein